MQANDETLLEGELSDLSGQSQTMRSLTDQECDLVGGGWEISGFGWSASGGAIGENGEHYFVAVYHNDLPVYFSTC